MPNLGIVREADKGAKIAGRGFHPLGVPNIFAAMKDPHATLRDQVLRQVLDGTGETDKALRQAAADRRSVPPELQQLIDKIHDHAYKVTDEDLAQLQQKYNDDQLFEIIVSAALGASRQRLLAGLAALEHTKDK